MSDREEAFIRGQAILMIARNQGRKNIRKRVLRRYLRCIKGCL
tara:strand:- start:76 stop:204 length:129 start_codon:yes stop_codon:yes gene_type:complete